jgi:hypothetical protein
MMVLGLFSETSVDKKSLDSLRKLAKFKLLIEGSNPNVKGIKTFHRRRKLQ